MVVRTFSISSHDTSSQPVIVENDSVSRAQVNIPAVLRSVVSRLWSIV